MARVVVLDTAALLAGLGPARGAGTTRFVTPPAARAEVRPGGATGRALEHALLAGLVVTAPTPFGTATADAAARETGDLERLSLADREVLALAVDEKTRGTGAGAAPVEVWTDDYAVQNVARRLGLATRAIHAAGITAQAAWHTRCTGCGRYLPDADQAHPCPICGSPLKRTRRPPHGRTE